MQKMARFVVTFVVLALMVTACGGDNADDGPDGTVSTAGQMVMLPPVLSTRSTATSTSTTGPTTWIRR